METYLSIADFVMYIKVGMYLWMVNILFRQEWKSLTVFNPFRSRTYRITAAVCGETAAGFFHNNKTNGLRAAGRLAYRYAASFTFDNYQIDYETCRILDGKIQVLFRKIYRSLCTSLISLDNTNFPDTKVVNQLSLINSRLRHSLIGNKFVRVSDRYPKGGQMGALYRDFGKCGVNVLAHFTKDFEVVNSGRLNSVIYQISSLIMGKIIYAVDKLAYLPLFLITMNFNPAFSYDFLRRSPHLHRRKRLLKRP